MSFWYNDNLKIEFRAVPYSTKHVLEYRISPDQDLNFEIEKSFLGIKYKKKKKYKTNWHQPQKFLNYPGAYHNCEDDCYLPIFIDDRNELERIKMSYKTIGDFFAWRNAEDKKQKDEWEVERNEYLKEHQNWY